MAWMPSETKLTSQGVRDLNLVGARTRRPSPPPEEACAHPFNYTQKEDGYKPGVGPFVSRVTRCARCGVVLKDDPIVWW
jgi:hypothetical protein